MKKTVLLVSIGAVLLAACGSESTPAELPPPALEVEQDAPPVAETATEPVEQAAEATATVVVPTEVAPTEVVEPVAEAPVAEVEALGPPPPVDSNFRPTDPTTVSLASGGPQLVEFFAFW